MKKASILLIEDNNEIRENTAEILELANYDVETAENGKVGVEKALAKRPDIIICDVMMPVLDGYGVLHLMNNNPSLTGIPFIFLTAKSERSDFRKGMELGADDYITKPFTDHELLTAIESRLKKSEALRKDYSSDEKGMTTMIRELTGKGDLKQLAENRPENTYRRKQVIYTEGNHPQRLFYIRKGKVKTYISNDDGKSLTIDLYGEGDFFGYNALLEGTTYRETAEAIDDSVICDIAIEEFSELVHHNPDVTKKFIKLLAKNITEKEKQLLSLAYNSLRKRVATALITLQEKYKAENDDQFVIQLSREGLASIAGTATESLIRTLSDFKHEKLIDLDGSTITILNEKKLRNMLN